MASADDEWSEDELTLEEMAGSDPNVRTPGTHRVILQNGFKGSKYSIGRVTTLKPQPYEVQIRVKASGISFHDLMVRQGAIEGIPKTPFTPGFECSGDVTMVGAEVSGFQIGDRVMAFMHFGAWSEFVNVPANYVFKMPEKMSYEEGAAFPTAYTLAYLLLIHIGNVKQGSRVFAHSLDGSVGIAICQMCRNVIENVPLLGTAAAHKRERLKNMANIIYDRNVDYVFDTKQMYPEGVDVVIDNRFGEDYTKSFGLLAPLGKYILYATNSRIGGETGGTVGAGGSRRSSLAKTLFHTSDKISPTKYMEDNLSFAGLNFRKLFFAFSVEQGDKPLRLLRHIMHDLCEWYKKGKLHPIIDSIWAFDELPDALNKLKHRHNFGKLILDPSREKIIVETTALHQRSGDNSQNVVEGTVIGNIVMENE